MTSLTSKKQNMGPKCMFRGEIDDETGKRPDE
jgi:hypothetical protein